MTVNSDVEIAVLIPVYNASDDLISTVNSLQNNDVAHHIYIVDDGSEIPVYKKFPELSEDKNITIITMDNNVGITKALNAGLKEILKFDYKYVARMDSGDTCRADRFQKQVDFLESNLDIALVGSRAQIMDNMGNLLFLSNQPLSHNDILHKLHFNSAFMHPSLMIRTKIFKEVGLYDEKYIVAQDYELMRRINQNYKTANLADNLLQYIVDDNSLSVKKRKLQVLNRIKIQLQYFNYCNIKSYLGVAQSVVLYFMPLKLLTFIKKMKSRTYTNFISKQY